MPRKALLWWYRLRLSSVCLAASCHCPQDVRALCLLTFPKLPSPVPGPSHFLPLLPVFSVLPLGSCCWGSSYGWYFPRQPKLIFPPKSLFALKSSNVQPPPPHTNTHTRHRSLGSAGHRGPDCFFSDTGSPGQQH